MLIFLLSGRVRHTRCGLVAGVLTCALPICSLRSAAFCVAAIEGLLPDGPIRIGLYGAGSIADEIVPALFEAFQVDYIRVLSRRPEKTREFVDRHQAAGRATLSVAESAEHVVGDADLVITLPEAKEPLVRPGLLRPNGPRLKRGKAAW